MKRKYLAMALSMVMTTSIFVGCGNKDTGSKGDKIELTYVNWNLATEEENNLERRMIAEYEAANPNIDVVIADYIDTNDYDNSLTTAAAGGKLPDVFMLKNIPSAMANEWLMDVSTFTEGDEDWNKVSKPVIESTQIEGKSYAIPAGQFLAGYFVNKDLFESENVKQPEIGYTYEEFEEAIKSMTQPSKNIVGLRNELEILDWYEPVKNNNSMWHTFDGEKYNLTNDAFKEGIVKANAFAKNGYSYETLDEETKQSYTGGVDSIEVWKQGQIAISYDGTWAAGDLNNANFDYEFIGLPGNKNIIINDYMGISKDSKNAEEAYKFAKWMTFSKEGTMKRIDICEENDMQWGSLPILNDEEVNKRFFEWNEIPGVEDAYKNLDNSIVEGVKVIPGFLDSRWNASTGLKIGDKENASVGDLLVDMTRGTTKPEDYLSQVNDIANKNYEEAKKTIKALAE